MAIDVQHNEAAAVEPEPAVTLRAVILGLFLVVALDVLAIYVRYVFHGSLMTYSHIPMAMLMVLMLMLLSLAVVARATGWTLSTGEWHAILAMGVVGAALPCFGHVGYLIGYISAPYYFATE
ncbi:MAG: hypothetical protein HOH77_23410, partial [Candidatus Latescibacteria bacterium]|nr:hypothetical protein [Candidatus Latescibacterota bacterium]